MKKEQETRRYKAEFWVPGPKLHGVTILADSDEQAIIDAFEMAEYNFWQPANLWIITKNGYRKKRLPVSISFHNNEYAFEYNE